MKRTTGFADLQESGESADDQHLPVPGSTGVYRVLPARVVPNLYRTLAFLVAALLHPAAGIAVGTVGSEVTHRAAAEERVAQYPVGDPTRCHVRQLAATTHRLPDLGIDWRWADLSSKQAVGTAILSARIVLIDPRLECAEVPGVVVHEWTHIVQADLYGGGLPDGTLTSDLVDDHTGRRFEVPVQEVVADCAAALLTGAWTGTSDRGPYLRMLGGCPADMAARAREVLAHGGVTLDDGRAPLSQVGAGVA